MSEQKRRLRLDDRQVRIFIRDMEEFGYPLTFKEARRIADEVADGTHSESDPVALILCQQIDEAMEAAQQKRRPRR